MIGDTEMSPSLERNRANHRMSEMPHSTQVSRRTCLGAGLGFGALALQSLLQREAVANHDHFPLRRRRAKAKSVIWLFMRGGVSHLESFDPKPKLDEYAGLSISETPFSSVQDPEKLKKVRVVVVNDANGQQRNKLYPTQIGFKKYGQSGIEVSDWFPRIAGCIDDIAVVRSMWTTDDNHGAQIQFHSGRHMLDERAPTIGAWLSWGLGSLNDNLPEFITMGPRFFDTRDGHYLGPAYDAVPLKIDPQDPLPYARPEMDATAEEQQLTFDLARRLNSITAARFPDDEMLQARMKSYELAFHMQTSVPDVIRFDDETRQTQSMYGLDDDKTKPFGMQLLAARRFVERGVRFIQIMHGDGAAGAWDAHSNLKSNHAGLTQQVDKPIAGLLMDLKRRGLLEETIVVFATEFGRTPGSQRSNGRDHHPYGFSIWLAGGGIKGGQAYGATDDFGYRSIVNRTQMADLHATIFHLMGLDHSRVTFHHNGRDERLTDVYEAKVIDTLLA